jgi:diguanylate cyclase (GGDEF)-like protein/PAS domain S-box-containing protein
VRSTCHDVSSADDLSQPDLKVLFDWWRGLAGGRATPPVASWATGRHLVDDANLVALRRVDEHAFVYEHYGEGLTQLTGFRLQGQSLKLSGYDAALNVSSAIADLYVRKYEESIARGVALLTLNQAQINARVHAWERLLLPFGEPDDGLVVACVRPQLFRHEVLASLSRIARFGSATLEPVRRGETVVDYVMIEATALGPVLCGVAPLYLSSLIDVAAFPDLMRRIEGAEVGECVLETTLDKSEGGEARFVRVEIFGAPVRPFVTVVDVTDWKRAERLLAESSEQLREAHRMGKIGTWRRGVDSEVVEWSPECFALLRYDPSKFDTTRANIMALYEDATGANVQRIVQEAARSRETLSTDVRYRRGDGTIADFVATCRAERDSAGKVTGFFGTMQDISARKDAERQLERLAFFDPLTGLANRALLRRRLDETVERALADAEAATLLLVDLDRFKEVNDSLGHAAGDEVLSLVAAILNREAGSRDVVARLGGDEFAMIVQGPPERAEALAANIVARLAEPLRVVAGEAFIGASIGVVAIPEDAARADDAMRRADLALYDAKTRGRGRARRFEPAMAALVEQRLDLARHLRQAIGDGGLSVHYQPQVDLVTGRVEGLEALMRWTHPERGPISPAEFIPIAESSGLICDLGVWILREACAQGRAWLDGGAPRRTIAVNVSPAQFWNLDFEESVREALRDTGFPPELLCLELTEGLFVDHAEARVRRTLDAIAALGVGLALDDFGTGYSSLGYLTRLPFDRLKIARPFVDGVATRPRKRKLLEGMVAVGRGLDMIVVAEGAEITGEVDVLREVGCDIVQGFYFARPSAAPQALAVAAEIDAAACVDAMVARLRSASRGMRRLADDEEDVVIPAAPVAPGRKPGARRR